MSSLNESRSTDNVRRSEQRVNAAGHLLGSVRSSPAATEQTIGADLAIRTQRPHFISADNVNRLRHTVFSESNHPAMSRQPPQQARTAGGTSSGPGAMAPTDGRISHINGSVYMPLSFREVITGNKDIVSAMAELERRASEKHEDEEKVIKHYDSAVDDAKTFPVLPPITRRNSDRRMKKPGECLSIRSLPDLSRIKSSFTSVSAWEGTTDAAVILHILETHPDIDVIYMSPALPPSAPNYSQYYMQMVSPGAVDVMNYCTVGRHFVVRYIKGKQPHRMSLKRWVFEQSTTVKLRQNPFFKNFRMMKAFYALGSSQDMRKFGKTRRKLRSILNICNPTFAETLTLVHTMCLDLRALNLIQVDRELTYTLGEFMEEQEHFTHEITSKIERYTAMMVHLTSRTCWDDVIGAGLAVEREERKSSAPKRINELRKMQRMKQRLAADLSGGSVASPRSNVDESCIGTWVHPEEGVTAEMEAQRVQRCAKLARFIYQLDCILRQALHHIYTASLSITADYLHLQMETFPTDDEIKALVKGYIGDLDVKHMETGDDDDDHHGGPGATAAKEAKKPAGGKKHGSESDSRSKSGKGAPPKPNAKDSTTVDPPPNNFDQLSTGTVTPPLTGAPVSSSTPFITTSDSLGFESYSNIDHAVYSNVTHGELGEGSDSLDSSSSTLSDEVDENTMGNRERPAFYSAQDLSLTSSNDVDDLNSPVVTGTVVRSSRMSNGHAAESVEEASLEPDDVTVIENDTRPTGAMSLDSHVPLVTLTQAGILQDNIASEDLTITSDEKVNSGASRDLDTYFVTNFSTPQLVSDHGTVKARSNQMSVVKKSGHYPIHEADLRSGLLDSDSKHPSKHQWEFEPESQKSERVEAVTDLSEKEITTASKAGSCRKRSSDNEKTNPAVEVDDGSKFNFEDGKMLFANLEQAPDMMGIFGQLFDQVVESSVDTSRDNLENVLDIPILDGEIWEPEETDHYMNVRSSRSSSVDEGALPGYAGGPEAGQHENGHVNSMDGVPVSQVSSHIRSRSRSLSNSSKSNNLQDSSQNQMDASTMSSSSQNQMDASTMSSTVDREEGVEDSVDSPNMRAIYPVVLYTPPSRAIAMSDRVSTNQIDIIEFLSREMDHPYMNNEMLVGSPNSPTPAEVVDDVAEDDYTDAEIRMSRNPLIFNSSKVEDQRSGPQGARKDGGKRRKGSKGSDSNNQHNLPCCPDQLETLKDPTRTVGESEPTQISSHAPNILEVKHHTQSNSSRTSSGSSTSENCPEELQENVQHLLRVLPTVLPFLSPMQHNRQPITEKQPDDGEHEELVVTSPPNFLVAHSLHNNSETSFISLLDKISEEALKDLDSEDVEQDNGKPQLVVEIFMGRSQQKSDDTENDLTNRIFEASLMDRDTLSDASEVGGAREEHKSTQLDGPEEESDGEYREEERSRPEPPMILHEKSNNNRGHELKPMFHAAVHHNKEVTGMMPDIYDFTAAAFNMIHDMEEHLLGIEMLTSNWALLPFLRPTVHPGTPVDKKPCGPSLELVLRKDVNLINVKNSIYSCIDTVFHCTGVYLAALQQLYTKYFLTKLSAGSDAGNQEVMFYQEALQRHDTQLKIVDRIPESQRLGMFLIDLTPYKDNVRGFTLDRLSAVQELLNSDVMQRTRQLIQKLDNLITVLESHPAALDALYIRLTTADSLPDILRLLENSDVNHIISLYNIIDRFAVPHNEDDRRAFESTHYLVTSVRHAGNVCLRERTEMVEGIERCLERDVAWIQSQVKKVLKPMAENSLFLDGKADVLEVMQALTEAEQLVRSYVTKANFVREIQRYLGKPESHFRELFQLSSRYVNTRNLWLLMADWDTKLNQWKHQSFVTLDIQKINNYTFKYMEACNKLEKVLPKNSVVAVFGEKMDVMLRWLNFIIEFRSQSVKARHWRQIEEVLGVEFGDALPLTLASLMSIRAIEKQKNLHVILNKARAESNVQNEYDEVCQQCTSLTLTVQSKLKPLIEGETPVTIHLLGDTFEIEESLNYCVMELERIDQSPHSGFLHDPLEQFVQRIFETLENIVTWAEMQMKISRLRRLVIRHPELSQTLPNDVIKYKQIFMDYSHFMETVTPNPSVLHWCTAPDLHQILEAQHNDVINLYRAFKRDIELRGATDTGAPRDQPHFGI